MPGGKLSHLQVNVRQEHLPFYRDLFTFLQWQPIYSDEHGAAFNSEGDVSLWFMAVAKTVAHDVDGPGVNHIGLAAESQAAVDATVTYLGERGVPCLFETPRHRPDFSHSERDTYYQVMFASPDGILFEHVYIGPKQEETIDG
jgi:catechol 2,3-dioxygenase-like lactoylglutathione lyase family enzyme